MPLIAYPMIAIQHVVELFYYGETRVLTSFKGQVFKTLDFLEVDYDNPSAHRAVPTTVTPTQQVIKPIEANKATASQVNGKFFIPNLHFVFNFLFHLISCGFF